MELHCIFALDLLAYNYALFTSSFAFPGVGVPLGREGGEGVHHVVAAGARVEAGPGAARLAALQEGVVARLGLVAEVGRGLSTAQGGRGKLCVGTTDPV